MRTFEGALVAVVVIGCDPAAPGPAASATTKAEAARSAAPTASTTTAAPTASSPAGPASAGDAEDKWCIDTKKSREWGSVSSAEAPYQDCAKSLKMHCGGKDGERGGLCGYALDTARTEAAREKTPDACCYNVPAIQ